MDTWVWIVIIGIILLLWYFWTKYGTIISNPEAAKAASSVARYATDIEGLIGGFESASNTQGSFMSRMGAFFGALPS